MQEGDRRELRTSRRVWFLRSLCQDEIAISSMRDITFRHGSLDFEHNALININLRKSFVSIQDKAFPSCIEGKMIHAVVNGLQAVVDGLSVVEGKPTLTKDDLGRMFDVAGMMFGVQWPAGCPVTLCETLY